jgi:hypothetical protein
MGHPVRKFSQTLGHESLTTTYRILRRPRHHPGGGAWPNDRVARTTGKHHAGIAGNGKKVTSSYSALMPRRDAKVTKGKPQWLPWG